jgi:hypothetical protein
VGLPGESPEGVPRGNTQGRSPGWSSMLCLQVGSQRFSPCDVPQVGSPRGVPSVVPVWGSPGCSQLGPLVWYTTEVRVVSLVLVPRVGPFVGSPGEYTRRVSNQWCPPGWSTGKSHGGFNKRSSLGVSPV